jgi:proteasome accessory factor A
MDRNTPFNSITEHLTPFLVTRLIFCGAGKLGAENESEFVPFQISQRADFFETEIGLDTMVKRPIINTRDEPHANREKYRRLHVIVGDSNMSEYTIYLKTGVTSIVLSMIEDQYLEKSIILRNPVKTMKELSRDLTCKKLIELDNGKRMTAVEIQRLYLEQAQRYSAERASDPISTDVLHKWAHVLNALEVDPFSLSREIDWVIKWHLLHSYMEKRGEGWESSRVAMMDLQYHDIRADKGLYYLLQRAGEVERIVTNEEILWAMENPPTDTRAYFRGMCLKKFRNHIFGVNWDSLSFNVDEGPIKRVLMEEPVKGSKAHVEGLLARSNTVEELLINLSL